MQHVGDFGHRFAVGDFVDVRENWQSKQALDLGQNRKPALQARPAKTVARGSIGLVIARFEDERQTEVIANLRQRFGGLHDHLFILDDARPGDDKQRRAIASESELANADSVHDSFCFSAASMKPRKRG